MAESNVPKQDFAPPWLKFPTTDNTKTSSQKLNSYQNERNRQRREDPYHSRNEYSRLHRQTSFEFHDAKRYPQGKYRHHSVDDDYYGYQYGYNYYAPNYNYEKYGMQYSSQPSLARQVSRDSKYSPGRFSQINGGDFSPHYELYEPQYYHQSLHKRGHHEKDHHHKDREDDGKGKNKSNEKDRPFTDDFPSLVGGSGETTSEVKQAKPGAGVWENPPKSNKNEETPDLLKNTSSGIYKALVPSKGSQIKKNGRESIRINGSIRDSSPLSPSNKSNKEGTRHSPTPDLAIVTQPKKLGDKKSEFLRALRHESNLRNGDYQDLNQNAIDKKQPPKYSEDGTMNEDIEEYIHLNGNHVSNMNESKQNLINGSTKENVELDNSNINGEALVNEVDHINLSGEEEEKRLLLSMGWVEEDNTEYVITEDEIREFQHLLKNHCNGQKNGFKTTLRNALTLKLESNFSNGLLNGDLHAKGEDSNKPL